jgi:hypothetical protein
MAVKKTSAVPTAADAAAAFRLIADWIDAQGESVTVAAALPAAEPESDEEEGPLSRDEVAALTVTELRALAVELGLEEQKVKAGILAELDESGYYGDDEDESDEDDEAEVEEDEEEEDGDSDSDSDEEDDEEGLTREDLEGMDLKELKALAKQEGHALKDYRSLDQEGLIELLMGEDESDEEEDEEDSEEEAEELDEDALNAMNLAELKKLAGELGVKIPVNIAKQKSKIVDLILDAAGVEDDEDDE